MGAVAEAVLERFQDQVALDFGDRAADQIAGDPAETLMTKMHLMLGLPIAIAARAIKLVSMM